MPFVPPDPPPPDYYVLDENGNPIQVSRFLFDRTRVAILELDRIAGNMDVITFFLGCRDVKYVTQLCAMGRGNDPKPPSLFSRTRAAALARHGLRWRTAANWPRSQRRTASAGSG